MSQPHWPWCYSYIAFIDICVRGLSGKFEDKVNNESKTSNNMELSLFVLLKSIPICKFLNKILNIFMQWGVGHGALRQFPWCFRIISYFSYLNTSL